MNQNRTPESDLHEICQQVRSDLEALQGAQLFITGGTGFFGQWLVDALLEVNQAFGLSLEITLLSRRPDWVKARFKDASVTCLEGDLLSGKSLLSEGRSYTHLIHMAAPVNQVKDRNESYDVSVQGTQTITECAQHWGVSRFLFTSSGAVYGNGLNTSHSLTEEFTLEGAEYSEYAQGKRRAEEILLQQTDFQVVVARCFAFMGPHLPLEAPFAVTQFIRSGLFGEVIQLTGDGRPLRSYLYGVDLVRGLLQLLVRGKTGEVYNLGSDVPVSIRDLAEEIGQYFGVPVKCQAPGMGPIPAYVPNIDKIKSELGFSIHVDWKTALARTLAWYRGE